MGPSVCKWVWYGRELIIATWPRCIDHKMSSASAHKSPLSSSAEAALNRDLSRRKALASAAVTTKGGWEKKRTAIIKAIETLKAQEAKAYRSMSTIQTSSAAAQARADDEAAALSKSEASLATLENLHSKLHQRKAAILEERTTFLQDDEQQRSALSVTLHERLNALNTTRSAVAARNGMKPTGGSSSGGDTNADGGAEPLPEAAAAEPDPYVEHHRLRMDLLHMADAFDASEVAFTEQAKEGAARRAALGIDVALANEAIVAAEAHAAELGVEGKRLLESETQLSEAMGGFSAKFKAFNETSKNASESFSTRVQALTTANQSVRLAEMEVKHLKLVRVEHAKETKVLKDLEALKAAELARAAEKTAKMKALCDGLRDQAEIAPEFWGSA